MLPSLSSIARKFGQSRRQHLLVRPGSHQQRSSSPSVAHVSTLRHLVIASPVNVGRCDKLMIALIVPGLLILSCEIAEVSVTPGRACANICHSRLVVGIPEPSSSPIRVYWLPISPLMFTHSGWAGSFGGFAGSNAMWHDPHVVPIRNGGS